MSLSSSGRYVPSAGSTTQYFDVLLQWRLVQAHVLRISDKSKRVMHSLRLTFSVTVSAFKFFTFSGLTADFSVMNIYSFLRAYLFLSLTIRIRIWILIMNILIIIINNKRTFGTVTYTFISPFNLTHQ